MEKKIKVLIDMETKVSVGSVKFFSVAKGFGFIKQDSGDDIFFHISEVQDGRELQEGDRVEFEIGQSKKGPCAVQVRLLEA